MLGLYSMILVDASIKVFVWFPPIRRKFKKTFIRIVTLEALANLEFVVFDNIPRHTLF